MAPLARVLRSVLQRRAREELGVGCELAPQYSFPKLTASLGVTGPRIHQLLPSQASSLLAAAVGPRVPTGRADTRIDAALPLLHSAD